MKRYKTLLFAAVVFVAMVAMGTVLFVGHADDTTHKPDKVLTDYTTLPAEHVAVLAAEYEKQYRVKINFEIFSEEKLFERLLQEKAKPKSDLVLADRLVLEKAAKQELFAEYVSEATDMIAEDFRDSDNAWIGVWFDPVVFCINSDYLHTLEHYPMTWQELKNYPDMKLGLTDFLAADASANLLCYLVSNMGEEQAFSLLANLHPRIVQYAKYLSTPVRMAGMGEVNLAVAVQSETLRYINEGYPLKIIYPSDGTAYTLTGIALSAEAAGNKTARAFADWLLGDEAQLALKKNKFFFVSTNPDSMACKTFGGKNLVLFEKSQGFGAKERHALLDKWVKNIRLK